MAETLASSPTEPVADEPAIAEASNDDAILSEPVVIYRSAELDEKFISNSTSLLSLLDSYEGMIDILRRQPVYATTYPFNNADVQSLAWMFLYGKLDGWTDKIAHFYVLTSSREYMPLIPTERFSMPILRMSAALRILPQHEEDKVKYVIVSQHKENSVSYKLLVSHSRKAAGMDIFYELLNGNSVVFIGLVSKDVAVPVDAPHKHPTVQFTRVDSVKDMLDVTEEGDGKVPILC